MPTSQENQISTLLQRIDRDELVIPEFQRGFVWDAKKVADLLESLILGYPISSLLLLDSNEPMEYRWVRDTSLNIGSGALEDEDDEDEMEGEANAIEDENETQRTYILDGQQRITSMYLIFPENPLPTPEAIANKKLQGARFFIDLNKLGFPPGVPIQSATMLDDENMESVIRVLKYSDVKRYFQMYHNNLTEQHYIDYSIANKLMPLTRSFLDNSLSYLDSIITASMIPQITDLQTDGVGLAEAMRIASDRFAPIRRLIEQIQARIIAKRVLCEVLGPDDSHSLTKIFETINTTGVKLNIFDLMVAKLGSWQNNGVNTSLRKEIRTKIRRDLIIKFDDEKNYGGTLTREIPRVLGLIRSVSPTLKYREILSYRNATLRDGRDEYRQLTPVCLESMNRAMTYMLEHMGCFSEKYIPFKDLITLSSAIFYRHTNNFNQVENIYRAFYWSKVFTIKLDQGTTGTIFDTFEEWNRISENNGNARAELLNDLKANFPSFDLFFDDEVSDIHVKGILTFILHKSLEDWSGNNLVQCSLDRVIGNNKSLEDHHIYPKRFIAAMAPLNERQELRNKQNIALNRVLVSREANNGVANDNAPWQYLKINNFHESDHFKKILFPSEFCEQIQFNLANFRRIMELRYNLIKNVVVSEVSSLLNL